MTVSHLIFLGTIFQAFQASMKKKKQDSVGSEFNKQYDWMKSPEYTDKFDLCHDFVLFEDR